MALEMLHPEWKKPVLGVLFDMDGVIVDTERLYTIFWQMAANQLGYPMTREQALGMRSLNRDTAKAKMESYFGPGTSYEAIRTRRIELMDPYVAEHGVDPKPGIYELLDALDARGIPAAAAKLAATAQGSTDAATAIMTTDTHKKEYAIQFELGGKTCTVGAIGKGSGMIAPNMATMLAFYTTDAAVSPALLEKALKTVVPGTYNQMSVDLDTSTNDTLIILASGLAGNPEITEENADYEAFVAALTAIAEHMCAEHAGDGEGATHLITCEVTHAPDLKTARAVSRSVVCSNLFKAAVFGRDANWGRILCAIGYTPGDFSIDKVCVWLSSAAGEVYVCENAAYHPYSEDEAAKVLAEHDVLVKVDMGTGDASAKAWGCDLTYDYVKINGDYRT